MIRHQDVVDARPVGMCVMHSGKKYFSKSKGARCKFPLSAIGHGTRHSKVIRRAIASERTHSFGVKTYIPQSTTESTPFTSHVPDFMSRRNVPERASATAQEKAALTSTNTAAVDVDDLDAWGVFKKALIFQGQWNKVMFRG